MQYHAERDGRWRMNVLFLIGKFPSIGGVETVTTVLANYMAEHGDRVHIAAFEQDDVELMPPLGEMVQLHRLCKPVRRSVKMLRRILVEHEIGVIVNQWCLPYYVTRACRRAMRGLACRLVAVHHNAPDANARINGALMEKAGARSRLRRMLADAKLRLYRLATCWSMRYVYRHSDSYVLLSESFRGVFQRVTGVQDLSKLCVIPNPLTLGGSAPAFEEKRCELLYLGRLERVQKRVDRVLHIWAALYKRFPEWTLRVVGDGPDRPALESLSADLGLERIRFEGFQPPEEYYRRAAVLLLTSEFEGFGLVLCEGMSMGTIPVVYGSYAAAYDIVSDGNSGYVLDAGRGFHMEEMAARTAGLMEDEVLRRKLYEQAILQSKRFGLERIGREWEELFQRISS